MIKLVESEFGVNRENLPDFKAGDTVNVHVKIKEGSKECTGEYFGTGIP